MTDLPPATYTASWSFPPYSGTTVATNITSSCNSSTLSDSLLRVSGTRHACCTGCVWPLPTDLFYTDANGTHTLSNGGAVGGSWGGFYQFPDPGFPGFNANVTI